MDSVQIPQIDNGRTLSLENSKGKVKNVVGKLDKCWVKLAHTESNVYFFNELLKRDISTRDIFYFALKQTLQVQMQ